MKLLIKLKIFWFLICGLTTGVLALTFCFIGLINESLQDVFDSKLVKNINKLETLMDKNWPNWRNNENN